MNVIHGMILDSFYSKYKASPKIDMSSSSLSPTSPQSENVAVAVDIVDIKNDTKTLELKCKGCEDCQANQLAHMGEGGCLSMVSDAADAAVGENDE
jgi:hypothetical protein